MGAGGERRGRLSVAAVVVAIGSAFGGSAGAQQVGPGQPDSRGTDAFVTIAARECDEYTDIRANLARNNIMESLQDLGADTLYSSGDQVDPRTEQAGQPECRPLVAWRFTFGSSYQTRAVTGVWGALSKVLDPDGTSVVTQASVPARGYQGEVLAGQRIAAATTIELSDDQLSRAGRNALWLQGGEPDDPVLYGDPTFAGRYGFGALRCAIDDLNGDNVETVQFPSGVRHVFCFAYYVTPPPSSGTIVIRKEVQGSGAGTETFGFGGNVSYNPGGAFDLTAGPGKPASETFYRAETGLGDQPWRVSEAVPAGWALTGLDCTSAASTVATDLASGRATISLAAGDTVTCTYVNRPRPTRAVILVRKITEGALGTFDLTVRDEHGDEVTARALSTRRTGVAASGAPIAVEPGRYQLTERLPLSSKGVWRRVGASCNGQQFGADRAIVGVVTAASGAVCTIVNRLDKPGAITLRKVTVGGTGTAAFVVSPSDDPTIQRRQTARTTRQGRAVTARGQSLDELPFGRYVIQESVARPQDAGDWSQLAVLCDGRLTPFEQGRVVVRLTRADPHVDCRFVNVRERSPRPPGPGPDPGPDPDDPPGPDPVPGGDAPDLTVQKRLVSTTPGATPIDTWRITVANGGRASAGNVVVGDQISGAARFLTARAAAGSCTVESKVLYCALDGLRPGATTTVTVRVRRDGLGTWTNVAAVGSGTPDATVADNTARVHVGGISRSELGPCATVAGGPVASPSC